MSLYYNTVTPLLHATLKKLMGAKELLPFRLVGGTALSLQLGHRESVDIDLFTDEEYDSVDFAAIDNYLRKNFPYVDSNDIPLVGFGKAYYIGANAKHCIKLDVYYTDKFIRPALEVDKIRLAHIEDVIAMKIDVVQYGGRKKDFWDIHELLNSYSLSVMLSLHKERYPYSHDRKQILKNFTDFEEASNDFNPICLRGKHWEVIVLDLIDERKRLQ